MTTYCIDFVDEDDARRVCLALFEKIANATRANADEHLDEVRTRHGEERTSGFAGDRTGKQRLTGTRRSDEQSTLRQTSAELGELLRILQELDDFLELDLRFVRTGNVVEGDFGSVACQQLRLGLSKAESFGAARLHRPEQEKPDSEDEQVREETDQDRRERRTRILGLDLHAVLTQARNFIARVLRR